MITLKIYLERKKEPFVMCFPDEYTSFVEKLSRSIWEHQEIEKIEICNENHCLWKIEL